MMDRRLFGFTLSVGRLRLSGLGIVIRVVNDPLYTDEVKTSLNEVYLGGNLSLFIVLGVFIVVIAGLGVRGACCKPHPLLVVVPGLYAGTLPVPISTYKMVSGIKKWFIVCLAMSSVMGIWYYNMAANGSQSIRDDLLQVHRINSDALKQWPPMLNTTADDFTESQWKIQQIRLELIKKGCDEKNTDNAFRESNEYITSSLYNFSICAIQKLGSTFWRQAISVLDSTKDISDAVFSTNRYLVNSKQFPFNTSKQRLSKTRHLNRPPEVFVLVTRDPFSRLFYAYVDKFYLPPQMSPLKYDFKNVTGRQKPLRCPVYSSFQAFLDKIVTDFKTGKDPDNHWAPIYSRCRPCEKYVVLLLKLETLVTDVEYLLFNVATKKTERITGALYSKNVTYTLSSLIRTYYHHVSKSNAFECIGAKGVAERIWTSLQLQGYLDETVHFPTNVNETKLEDSTYLIELVMGNINSHAMSETAISLQRKKSLARAYRGVDAETLRSITRLYNNDFKLFGYSLDPPTIESD